MTVTWQTPGTHNAGSGSCSPGFPASPASGDLLILGTAFGNPTNTPPPAPANFRPIEGSEWIGGAGSWGLDAGPRGVKCFYKFATGLESGSLSVPGGSADANAVISGQIMRFTKTRNNWFIRATGGSDSSTGAAYSVTGADSLGPVNGDQGIFVGAANVDAAVLSAFTLTWDGVATTVTQANQVANTQGHDLRWLLFRRNLAGSSTTDPVFAATMAVNSSGPGTFLLIHDDVAPVFGVPMAS